MLDHESPVARALLVDLPVDASLRREIGAVTLAARTLAVFMHPRLVSLAITSRGPTTALTIALVRVFAHGRRGHLARRAVTAQAARAAARLTHEARILDAFALRGPHRAVSFLVLLVFALAGAALAAGAPAVRPHVLFIGFALAARGPQQAVAQVVYARRGVGVGRAAAGDAVAKPAREGTCGAHIGSVGLALAVRFPQRAGGRIVEARAAQPTRALAVLVHVPTVGRAVPLQCPGHALEVVVDAELLVGTRHLCCRGGRCRCRRPALLGRCRRPALLGRRPNFAARAAGERALGLHVQRVALALALALPFVAVGGQVEARLGAHDHLGAVRHAKDE